MVGEINSIIQLILQVFMLGLGVICHEYSHGRMAELRGDSTARLSGRLTFNPIAHIDLFGTVILPLLLSLSGSSFIFGYAKPVPVDFSRLYNVKRDMVYVSMAGPLSNIVIALVLAAILKLWFIIIGFWQLPLLYFITKYVAYALSVGILINLVLAFFNMIPIPPLDGSKVVASLLPDRMLFPYLRLERYGFFLLMLVMYMDKNLLPAEYSGIIFQSMLKPVFFFFQYLTAV